MANIRGVRVPYFTSVKRRLQMVKSRVKTSKVSVLGWGKVVKTLLSLSQLLFWLLGCMMLGVVAFWLKHSPELTALLMWPNAPRTSLYCLYALIGTSGLMVAVGFVGIYVAHSENSCLVWTLLATALALFTALLSVGSVGFHRRADLANELIDKVYVQAVIATQAGDPGAISRINTFHKLLCGRQASEETVYKKTDTRDEYFKKLDEAKKKCMTTIDSTAKDQIRTLIAANLSVVAWWAVLVGVIMLLQIVFSMLLLCCPGLTSGTPELTDNPEDLLQD